MSRLFVAVWPDDETRSVLRALPRPDEPGVRWVRPQHWHVTLRFLGDADAAQVADALRPLALPAVTATLGPAISRLGRTVLCVPVRGLDALSAEVTSATESLGEPPDPRPFAGHLTLARLHQRGSCRLAGHKVHREMPVREVALVASTLGSAGPSYRTLETFVVGDHRP